MGFDTIMASRALQLVKGDVQKAIEELIQKGGILPPTPEESSPSSSGEKDTDRAILTRPFFILCDYLIPLFEIL